MATVSMAAGGIPQAGSRRLEKQSTRLILVVMSGVLDFYCEPSTRHVCFDAVQFIYIRYERIAGGYGAVSTPCLRRVLCCHRWISLWITVPLLHLHLTPTLISLLRPPPPVTRPQRSTLLQSRPLRPGGAALMSQPVPLPTRWNDQRGFSYALSVGCKHVAKRGLLAL